jgi:putative NADH-flavin reductase
MQLEILRRLSSGLLSAVLACAAGGCAGTAAQAPPPRLVVIGATAKSSLEIIGQALAAGCEVTAVARDPQALTLRDPHLRIVRGDVYDRASLAQAMRGGEVVISMVGPRVDPLREVGAMDLFSTGTTNIIAAMKQKGNRRLLVASSIGVENEFPSTRPDDMKEPAKMWLWNSRRLYQDMRAMEDIVRRSGLEYVIFRPGFMVQEPARNDLLLAVNQNSPKQRMITYADFGHFVLDQVHSDTFLGQTVGVYSERVLRFGENANLEELMRQSQDKARAERGRPDRQPGPAAGQPEAR